MVISCSSELLAKILLLLLLPLLLLLLPLLLLLLPLLLLLLLLLLPFLLRFPVLQSSLCSSTAGGGVAVLVLAVLVLAVLAVALAFEGEPGFAAAGVFFAAKDKRVSAAIALVVADLRFLDVLLLDPAREKSFPCA